MVCSRDILAYFECLAQSSGILGCKLGISIQDDLLWHPKSWVKILKQKSCHFFKRQSVFWGDGDHCWFQGSCVDFVGLTGGATFDILLDVLFHVRPPRVASCQS